MSESKFSVKLNLSFHIQLSVRTLNLVLAITMHTFCVLLSNIHAMEERNSP